MSEVATQAPFLVAGHAPEAVVAPASLDELREVVASRDGRTLVPAAGRTQLGLGGAPRGPFALLDVRAALAGEIEHEPADLTAVVPTGVTLGELGVQLAKAGQRLPIDPPHAEQATVGGVLAVGTGGPLRTRHGLPRDFVLGMTVLRADGELVKAGGRVVKNVTGYDLMRLWCGSLGTLGIITSVALRVLPRPTTVDLRFEVGSLAEGQALAERFLRADLRPELLDLTKGEGGWAGLARLTEGAVPKAETLAGADLMPCDENRVSRRPRPRLRGGRRAYAAGHVRNERNRLDDGCTRHAGAIAGAGATAGAGGARHLGRRRRARGGCGRGSGGEAAAGARGAQRGGRRRTHPGGAAGGRRPVGPFTHPDAHGSGEGRLRPRRAAERGALRGRPLR